MLPALYRSVSRLRTVPEELSEGAACRTGVVKNLLDDVLGKIPNTDVAEQSAYKAHESVGIGLTHWANLVCIKDTLTT
jgi:hypothetical protein